MSLTESHGNEDSAQPMELTSQDEPAAAIVDATNPPTDAANEGESHPAPMSKNALKRLRKKQAWDEAKGERRERRKEKRRTHKERIRSERAALIARGADPESFKKKPLLSTLVPVSIILDCDFESYMTDKERISLSSQVTRSYSDNRQARYRSNLWVAGFHGALERRFQNVLGAQHKSWKGIGFCEGDFLETAQRAREHMRKRSAGEEEQMTMIDSLQKSIQEGDEALWVRDEKDPFPLPDPDPPLDENHRDVIYLSSDSPYTLDRLSPNTCYVVGGLVDKNREKGLCYRRARERGIRTARLPIGQFMLMQSRQVLATNHVVEIMLKWLECGDWGQAFLSVIPKRKGGTLRGLGAGEEAVEDECEDEDEDEKVDEDEDDGEDDEGQNEKECENKDQTISD